jgi:hypothetical protein
MTADGLTCHSIPVGALLQTYPLGFTGFQAFAVVSAKSKF